MIPIVIEQLIRDKLKTLGQVTAIVGTGDAARIRAGELDQGETRPAITIELDEETRDESMSLDGSGGWITAEIVISSHADNYQVGRQLVNAIAYNGTDPSTGLSNWSTSSVECSLISTRRRMVPLNDGANGKRSIFRTRYRVVYREPN